MRSQYPVLPIAGSTLLRVFVGVLSFLTHWVKRLIRAHRNRRDAAALAGLDRHMLADMGITRSDLRDAFSEPFWEDPTALLRERALERRCSRALLRDEDTGFRQPRTDRPPKQAV
jgi:uncharacterized protein YjiS (DUF1127 family)